MMKKQAETGPLPKDRKLRAGVEAERQMAFYLNRDFATQADLFVLNDLRLVDQMQPEHDGRPGVCQIDHLLVHRWGVIIIESKSVTDEVAVRDDGSGGDEWTRKNQSSEKGIPSPIQQARRQGELLRSFLQRHRETLLGKMPTGMRSLSKLVTGTDQRGFGNMPVQIIVAISDNGKIRRVDGWTEPTAPFRTFVSKADLVPAKVREELAKHKSAGGLLAEAKGEYGVWAMKPEEVSIVADFLSASHQPLPSRAANAASAPASSPQRATPSGAACKKCSGTDLTANWGKYGYYWKCNNCDTNTTMLTVCSACGAGGYRSKVVKIRKDGPKYFRACEQCGIEEQIWTASASDA